MVDRTAWGEERPTRREAKEVAARLLRELRVMTRDEVERLLGPPDGGAAVAASGLPRPRKRRIEVRGSRRGARYVATYVGFLDLDGHLHAVGVFVQAAEGARRRWPWLPWIPVRGLVVVPV
jgi:hypothetical protein